MMTEASFQHPPHAAPRNDKEYSSVTVKKPARNSATPPRNSATEGSFLDSDGNRRNVFRRYVFQWMRSPRFWGLLLTACALSSPGSIPAQPPGNDESNTSKSVDEQLTNFGQETTEATTEKTSIPSSEKVDPVAQFEEESSANSRRVSSPDVPPASAEKDYLIPTDPVQLFLAGGFLMWPILLGSVIALWFGLERMVVLRKRRVIPSAFVDRFIQHLEQGKLTPETALRLCEENGSPIADVFAHGIRKWGKSSVEVEQAIIDGGERQVSQLRTHLRIINGVSTVSPLLGLQGTVVGMILSFNELARGGDADKGERLAGGIGVALITTAAGLFVAIPSLILYMYLSGRVDQLVMEMDLAAQKVVNLISSEAIASRAKSGNAKTSAGAIPVSGEIPAQISPSPSSTGKVKN